MSWSKPYIVILFSVLSILSCKDKVREIPEESPIIITKLGQSIIGDLEGDAFGKHLAISDDGMRFVTAAIANDVNGINAGQVKAYRYIDGEDTWSEQNVFYGDTALNQMGKLAISGNGDVFAVGVPLHSGSKGCVKVYDFSGNLVGNVITTDDEDDKFGHSIALSYDGSVLAVGGQGIDSIISGNMKPNIGRVRVYKLDGAAWKQQGQDLIGANANSKFGFSLDLSNDGAILGVGSTGNNGGKCYFFKNSGTNWLEYPIGGNVVQGETADDAQLYGTQLAISSEGETSAVVANQGLDERGYASIYENNGTGWQDKGIKLYAVKTAGLTSVSLSQDGNTLAVGYGIWDKENEDGDSGLGRGMVRIFRFENGVWKQISEDLYGKERDENFGNSVTLTPDGKTLAIGSVGYSSGKGKVQIFRLE
jgi:WD40 repeat protein